MESIIKSVSYLGVFFVIVVACYTLVRLSTAAYFKSKEDHNRRS